MRRVPWPAFAAFIFLMCRGNASCATVVEAFNITDFAGLESSFTFGTVTFGPTPGFSGITGSRLRVNDNSTDQFSFAFLNEKQHVKDGFSTTFSFEFPGPLTATGADGMAFILHNTDIGTMNPFGVDHHGLRNSESQLSLAFDSYQNDDQGETSPAKAFLFTDGSSRIKHATIDLQGAPFNIADLSDSGVHAVRIDYSPGDVDIYFDGSLVVQNVAIDLEAVGALDSNGMAYLGFGAFNGADSENHDVLAWSLHVTEVPEPSGLVSFVLPLAYAIRKLRAAARTRAYRR